MMKLKGKRAWVTGASSGMGRALSLLLAKEGTNLIVSALASEVDELEKLKAQCSNVDVHIEPFNLGEPETITTAAKNVLAKFQSIDALYHFGGISQRSFAVDTPIEVDRKIFEVNYFGTVALTKLMLPSMVANGGGQIGVSTSMVGKFGFPYRTAYSSSKHALQGFFESLRTEVSKDNIKISIFIGGRINTNISMHALDSKGNKHGKLDSGQANGITPDKAARQIYAGIKRNKKEVLVGSFELLMVHIRRFFPRLYYFLSTRINPM